VGIACLVAAIAMFGILEAVVKHLSQHYPLGQVIWARFFFHLVLVLPFALQAGLLRSLATARPGVQVLRSLLQLLATGGMFLALRHVPLAEAVAIVYLSPLIVTALSAPLLGEKIDARKWLAVGAGFAGVLVIMRPGLGVLHWAAAGALVTAAAYALFQVLTRRIGASESLLTTALYTPLVGTVATSAIAPFDWTGADLDGWALMVSLGVFSGVGHVLVVKAFQHEEASRLAPVNYIHIAWSVAIGIVVFDTVPDLWTLTGAAVIVASGLVVFARRRPDTFK
jgi:drug/metabolite transporter (DMT)-like permease